MRILRDGASWTPVTWVQTPVCAVSAATANSPEFCAPGIPKTQREPPAAVSPRCQRTNPGKRSPPWLTIARAPTALSRFTHAETLKLAVVLTVLGALTYADVAGSNVMA